MYILGTTSTPSPSATVPTADLVSLVSDTELPPLQPPPPLPPRRRNTNTRDSTSSSASNDVFISNRSTSPEPPQVPPRTDHDQPPPVPPRRDSMYNTGGPPRTPTLVTQTRTVPTITSRTQSVSQLPLGSVQNMQVQFATIPRCHGDRDSMRRDLDNIFNFNGENTSDIPALPPKTYRSHARQQSN